MLLTELRCAVHDCIGHSVVLMHICAMSDAMRALKLWSNLDAEIDLHAELWQL